MADWDTFRITTANGVRLTVELETDTGHTLVENDDPREWMEGSGLVRVIGRPDLAMRFQAWHLSDDCVAFVGDIRDDEGRVCVRTFAPPVEALLPARPQVFGCQHPDDED